MRLDYEPEHFNSVRTELRPGDLTFDIGAYDATTSILIADRVGAENVVIIEPAEKNWPNIQMNWEGAALCPPRATFAGFIDEEDSSNGSVYLGTFPPEARGNVLDEKRLEFRWLHYRDVDNFVASLPRRTIDTLSRMIGPPKAFTVDVEGAELLVLRGAKSTLEMFRPKVWVSVHPIFMIERFGNSRDDLLDYMGEVGYKWTLLKSDHEDHFFFEAGDK